MDVFLAALAVIMGLLFFVIGFRISFYPKKIIVGMLNYKYKTKTKYEPQKSAIVVAIIMGALLMLGGAYYIFIGVVSIYNLLS
ncbi:MAG: hypothetical protein WC152_01265 [Candidatus Izemoplasmatales bacterium]